VLLLDRIDILEWLQFLMLPETVAKRERERETERERERERATRRMEGVGRGKRVSKWEMEGWRGGEDLSVKNAGKRGKSEEKRTAYAV
jgi:hypothetical protein